MTARRRAERKVPGPRAKDARAPQATTRKATPVRLAAWGGDSAGYADRLRAKEILRCPQDDSERARSLKAGRPQLKAEGGLEEDLAIGGGGAAACAGEAGSGAGAASLGSAAETEPAPG